MAKTLAEYQEYQAAVSAFIAGESLTFLSTGCADLQQGCSTDDAGEPWFSWAACECCKDSHGGMREYLYARDAEDDIAQFTICETCVYYVNYGRLDDAQMIEIEESEAANG